MRAILRLALPSILSNITVPLLGMADTAIAGHMAGHGNLAAIALGGTILSMMYWLFNFLRMSTSGLVAQAHGASDQTLSHATLRGSLLFSLCIAALLLLLQYPIFLLAQLVLQPQAAVMPALSTYYYTTIWAAPAVLLGYSLTGWFVGEQNTQIPMWAAIGQNIINVLVSLIAVYIFELGVLGIALGTVVGAWSGAIFLWLKCSVPLASLAAHLREDAALFFNMASTNGVLFLRTLCLIAVTVYFTRAGSLLGVQVLEANTVLMQFFLLLSFFMDGFANAGEALCGKYLGAADATGLRQTIRNLMAVGFGLSLVFSAIYFGAGQHIVQLLTNQEAVVETCLRYLPWVVAMPLLAFLAFMWDGIFIGLTRSVDMLRSMAIAMIVFFVVWFALADQLHNHALWLAFDAYLLARGLTEWALYLRSPSPK